MISPPIVVHELLVNSFEKIVCCLETNMNLPVIMIFFLYFQKFLFFNEISKENDARA